MSKSQRTVLIVMGVLVLVVFCGLGVAVLNTLSPRLTDIPRPPSATRTPRLTNTLGPSNTPYSTESVYLQDLIAIHGDYEDALTTAGHLLALSADDMSLLSNPEWRSRMAISLALIEKCGRDLRSIEVPPRFATCHEEDLKMAHCYDVAVDLIAEGIDDLDSGKTNQALAWIESAESHMDELQECMEGILTGN